MIQVTIKLTTDYDEVNSTLEVDVVSDSLDEAIKAVETLKAKLAPKKEE